MIKGVNKRIIEINSPDSLYFEKAVFYLKPNVRELPGIVAENEINKVVHNLGIETSLPRPSSKTGRIFFILASLASAAGIILTFLN